MHNFLTPYLHFLAHHRVKVVLLFLNVILGIFLLAFSLLGIFPLGIVNFCFASFFLFLIALYRPVWVFLLLVGLLPYEIVNLAPENFGIMLRPYQWLMLLLLGAIGARALFRHKSMPMIDWRWFDALPLLFVFGAFLSAFGAGDVRLAFKFALILSSFVALFFIMRLFVRTTSASLQLVPFFLSSFLVIAFWSIMQNILFALGKVNFEVMAGRPNGSFAEADWLGMYLLVIIALALSWLYRESILSRKQQYLFLPLFLIFLSTLVLLLSMTRSAWLGFAGMGLFFSLSTLVTFWKLGEPKRAISVIALSGFVVCLALVIVPTFHLSRFALFNRALSTGGVQMITVACTDSTRIPDRIHVVEELETYGCVHIALEEREALAASGLVVREIGRDDPNVSIRHSIYDRARLLIEEHSILGIGWGMIGARLGSDERGASLNASNIFLEFWLGSGLIGLVAFVFLWFMYGFESGKAIFSGGAADVGFAMFFHLAWIGLTLFNLFNSGILLGFFFAFLGLGGLLFERKV